MRPFKFAPIVLAAGLVLAGETLGAQSGLLPAGTVILVRTTAALDSRTAQTGQTFEATVDQNVNLDGYSVLPAGTKVGGTIAMARPATRQQSGVIDLHFDRLIMSDGSTVPITGKLTSTDSAERRQINANPDAHVVLVGGRGGIGAAIAGAGSSQNPNNILAALGGLLSQGQDVSVPAETQLAVELERGVSLRRRGRIAAANDPSTLYTSADYVRAAQLALSRRNYYRGAQTGSLDNATRRALFAFQIDNNMTGTGNLDARTAQLLGLSLGATSAALTADQATQLRRDAQSVLGSYRAMIGINTNGRVMTGRAYTQAELEALFSLSAFADNASVYEQMVRVGGSDDAAGSAGRALLTAARRVDAAMNAVGGSIQTQWSGVRRQLLSIEAANPGA